MMVVIRCMQFCNIDIAEKSGYRAGNVSATSRFGMDVFVQLVFVISDSLLHLVDD